MNGQPLRLAVMEPRRLLRDFLVSAFDAAGFTILFAGDWCDAFIQSIVIERPDAAIADIRSVPGMPDFSGDLLQALGASSAAIPLLVLSDSSGAAEAAAYRSGAAAWLDVTKLSAPELLDATRQIATGTRLFSVVGADADSSFQAARIGVTDPVPQFITPRERQVLAYIGQGADNAQIAAHLGITPRTVKAHLSSLYEKLAVDGRTQLALRARELGVPAPREWSGQP